ncbi:cyclin-dependent kinase inhibitor 1 isoform X2 [Entelurus aequoreus]|uniref:cyclin-dependent kinase inhibitor 1 isoform X2 n=1 Tax=Entelurus aequoreus TaxID=161455 RepID=UPI002B1D352F|nr:cyclin-dependent kinase inhibitor 1 isoform X2 [Entelurus aequoreus]
MENCRMMVSQKLIPKRQGSGTARRNLFGPVNHKQLHMFFRTEMRKDLEEASRRWSYDFIADKPLESGHFHWESVPGTTVPRLFRAGVIAQTKGQRAAVGPKKRRAATSPKCGKENFPEYALERCPLDVEKTPEKKEKVRLRRKQTNITDFYQAKRRVVGTQSKSVE